MRRGRWRELLMSALALAGFAARAAAAEPDLAAPSVCAPPCAEGESCIGNRCERPTERSPATLPPLPDRQSPPPPPPGSAPTTGPQPAVGPGANHPPPPGDAHLQPPPGDSHVSPIPATPSSLPPPPLSQDIDQSTRTTYTLSNTRVKRGFLALPFVGLHSYAHADASAYAPGLRVGSLFGGRVGDHWSLNGELMIDFSNVPDASVAFSERAYYFLFSPLYDVAAGPVQLVFGPKLGIFVLRTEDGGDVVRSTEVQGWSAGLNAGVFVPVFSRMSIGGLLSFDFAGANQGCLAALSPSNTCGSPAAHGAKILGLTGGILF